MKQSSIKIALKMKGLAPIFAAFVFSRRLSDAHLLSTKEKLGFWLICLTLGCIYNLSAQISVNVTKTRIPLNENLELNVTVNGEKIKSCSDFPEIGGLDKAGTSSSTSMNIINGQVSQRHTLTQLYRAPRVGTYFIKPFTMTVNGEEVRFAGATIDVVAPSKQNPSKAFDPFSAFFGLEEPEEIEYIDVKDDAFFAITSNKDEVYVGEGFVLTVAFYVANNSAAPLQFFELNEQIEQIKQKITPKNCLEESFQITQVIPEPVEINGKGYRQYKLLKSSFFPINTETIEIPSVNFKMMKYKVANQASWGGRIKMQEDFKTYTSQPKKIKVKPLPAHPLREQVAVGNYFLRENISKTSAQTGESVEYQFIIEGEGNIATVSEPRVKPQSYFEFYDPNISQSVRRVGNSIMGRKEFNYYIIPQEAGTFQLGDYFEWIFFNPEKQVYDTLRANKLLNVTGESLKNKAIASSDLGAFYDKIHDADRTVHQREGFKWEAYLVPGVLGSLLLLTLVLGLRKRKKE
jgi:hypothetical protein